MPRSIQYTRKRFQFMQLCMCVVLAATIGAAALVDRHAAGDVYLDRAIEIGDVSLELPTEWAINIDQSNHVLQLTEPEGGKRHRTLTVHRRSASWFEGLRALGNPTPISFGELGRGLLTTSSAKPSTVQIQARVSVSNDDILEVVLDTGSVGTNIKAEDISLIKRICATATRRETDEP